MKYLLATIFLIGCEGGDRHSRDASHYYHTICIDGHQYYRGGYKLAIRLSPDGKPVPCKEQK